MNLQAEAESRLRADEAENASRDEAAAEDVEDTGINWGMGKLFKRMEKVPSYSSFLREILSENLLIGLQLKTPKRTTKR